MTRLTNDAAGRTIRTSVDIVAGGAQQQRDSTEYDLMDRVIRTRSYGFGTTPAEPLFTASTYDPEGNRRRLARWSSPDLAASPIDTIISRWGYDQGHRMVADTAPDGRVEHRLYDHASNVTTLVTRRGKTITMQYDALNRLVNRAVPSITYDSTLAGIGALDSEPYPRRPNAGTDYTIDALVETFGYDAAGRLTTAHNSTESR